MWSPGLRPWRYGVAGCFAPPPASRVFRRFHCSDSDSCPLFPIWRSCSARETRRWGIAFPSDVATLKEALAGPAAADFAEDDICAVPMDAIEMKYLRRCGYLDLATPM